MSTVNDTEIVNPFGKRNISDFNLTRYRKLTASLFSSVELTSKKFQVVILGAGKGTRLNSHAPKILYELEYPFGKSSILNNSINKIKLLKNVALIDKTIVVISQDQDEIYGDSLRSNDYEILSVPSDSVNGTAVTLNAVLGELNPDCDIVLLWGDLALWRLADLVSVMKVHRGLLGDVTFCTRIVQNPYVAFLRDEYGRIRNVVHSNEAKGFIGLAEQDCLSFVCSYSALHELPRFLQTHHTNGEVDFIHFIPFLSSRGFKVSGLPLACENSVYGLNTQERAAVINKLLNSYTPSKYSSYFEDIGQRY